MYIAIVADDIADRKQIERLIDRSDDSVKQLIGNLYVDTFGNVSSALKTPMKYDLFLLDFVQNPSDYQTIIDGLKSINAPALIGICRPDGIRLPIEDMYHGLWHIDKPIIQAKLNELILNIHDSLLEHATKKLEIRSKENTYYVEIDDILYAEARTSVNYVHLTTGEYIEHFAASIAVDERFVTIKKGLIVNDNHVTEMTKRKIKFDNGTEIDIPLFNKIPFQELL